MQDIFSIVWSSKYIKVNGSRSTSQEQKACLCVESHCDGDLKQAGEIESWQSLS